MTILLIVGYNFYHTNARIVFGPTLFKVVIENTALTISSGNISGIGSWCL